MATFVVLASFTDQGVRNVKETIGRAEAFTALPSRIFIGRLAGTTSLRSARAPDDEAATALKCLLARQRPPRDAACLLFRRNEEDPRQDGLRRSWQRIWHGNELGRIGYVKD